MTTGILQKASRDENNCNKRRLTEIKLLKLFSAVKRKHFHQQKF